jgi:hypothetical protein
VRHVPINDEVRGQDWHDAVSVDLRPGGRAVVDHPDYPYLVEVQFQPHAARRARPRRGFQIHTPIGAVTDVRLRARPGESIAVTDLEDVAAFVIALVNHVEQTKSAGAWISSFPRRAPEQGKATPTGFYREILRLYDKLKAEGSTRPAAEIAERYGKNRATVRSWLRRARELEGEE